MNAAELSLQPIADTALAGEWIRRYYAYEGLAFNPTVEVAVSRLLESSRFGWFFTLTRNTEAIGYAVMTRAFDHEIGGEYVILTDFLSWSRTAAKDMDPAPWNCWKSSPACRAFEPWISTSSTATPGCASSIPAADFGSSLTAVH